MIFFRKRKKDKFLKDLGPDMQIIVPSAKNFFALYRANITTNIARFDAKKVLVVDEEQRFRDLIGNIYTISSEALIDALIETGYKKEEKKWTIKNWF